MKQGGKNKQVGETEDGEPSDFVTEEEIYQLGIIVVIKRTLESMAETI